LHFHTNKKISKLNKSYQLYTGLLLRRIALNRSAKSGINQNGDDSDSSFFKLLSAFSSANDQKIEWTKKMMENKEGDEKVPEK